MRRTLSSTQFIYILTAIRGEMSEVLLNCKEKVSEAGESFMKIKLAILEQDQTYLNRIVSVFNMKYSDQFEIYSFTDVDIAMSILDKSRIDVFLAGSTFTINTDSIPKRCSFAYLVDSSDAEDDKYNVVFKYQKVDLIYKQILGLYAEKAGGKSKKETDGDARLILFNSPAGGTGTSTLAAAFCKHLAASHHSVLYLNLEVNGSADDFFTGEGKNDMSDVIFAVKNRKANLGMKLESFVKQDNSGVYYYSQPKYAMDMMSFTEDNISDLLVQLKNSGTYEYIIVDRDFTFTSEIIKTYSKFNKIVWVCDGLTTSNTKLLNTYKALEIMTENNDEYVLNDMYVIYNRFSNKQSIVLDDIKLQSIGGFPRYDHAELSQIIEKMMTNSLFDELM